MQPFTFLSPTSIHFGPGERKKIAPRLAGRYNRLLLAVAKGPFRENGIFDDIASSLESAGIEVFGMSDIDSNPKVRSAREGAEICRKEGIDAVLALGGGSAMDCAKVIGAAAAMDQDPYDLIWGKRLPVTDSLPVITMPSFAATGTEVNNFAVMVDENTKEKFYCQAAFPEIAVMDPEITLTVPIKLTVWGVMDILSHTFEFYFNGNSDSIFQPYFSEAIIKSTMETADKLYADPGDVNARGELMWNAVMAWGGLTKIGRGDPDMTCHGIEESFSGYFDIHHGACLGVLTPRWMEIAIGREPGPFARFARNIFGVSIEDDSAAARQGLEAYKKWLKSIEAPNTYSDIADIDFTNEGFTKVAENALRIYGGQVGHLTPLKRKDEIVSLLEEGLKPY